MQFIAILEAVQSAMSGLPTMRVSAFRTFAQTAAPLAVTALWQGIAVACCPGNLPAPRAPHVCSASLYPLDFGLCRPGLPPVPSSSVARWRWLPRPSFLRPGRRRPPDHGCSWTSAGAWPSLPLWALASIVRAVDLAIHSFRLADFGRPPSPSNPAATSTTSTACLSRLPGRKPVQICTTQQSGSPQRDRLFRAAHPHSRSGFSRGSPRANSSRSCSMKPSTCAAATTGPISSRSFAWSSSL